ncbi:MAG: hypothetical protein FWD48_09715 [Oscillospiraceae bacterium]|nr:hypothetical protein [Oscillospiraceae bacterium]
MNDILDEIYNSIDERFTQDINLQRRGKICEDLLNLLDEEGKTLFREYDEALGDYFIEMCRNDFKCGFRYGFRHVFKLLLHD